MILFEKLTFYCYIAHRGFSSIFFFRIERTRSGIDLIEVLMELSEIVKHVIDCFTYFYYHWYLLFNQPELCEYWVAQGLTDYWGVWLTISSLVRSNLSETFVSFGLQTLVQVPELQNLIGLIDRLGKLGEVLEVAVTQYGDLHLQVSQTMVSLGSEYRKLRVIGVRGIPTKQTDKCCWTF